MKISQKTLIPFIIILIISTLLINTSFGAFSFSSKPSKNEVTIDGKWTTPNEWKDAYECAVPLIEGLSANLGLFCVKNDGKYLYVLVDYISEHAKLIDGVQIFFDINNDGGSILKSDDWVIFLDQYGDFRTYKIYIAQGKKDEFVMPYSSYPHDIRASCTMDVEYNPYSKEPHLIYEFALPIGFFRADSEFGFAVIAFGGRALTMPPDGFNWQRPSTWAKLTLATPYYQFKTSATPTASPPTSTPIPTTTTTTTKTSTLESNKITTTTITTSSSKPTTITTKAPSESMLTQIPSGYVTMIGFIGIAVIAILAVIILKKKKIITFYFFIKKRVHTKVLEILFLHYFYFRAKLYRMK